jgi:hypothetical protein
MLRGAFSRSNKEKCLFFLSSWITPFFKKPAFFVITMWRKEECKFQAGKLNPTRLTGGCGQIAHPT